MVKRLLACEQSESDCQSPFLLSGTTSVLHVPRDRRARFAPVRSVE
jgi:hypothetical protein